MICPLNLLTKAPANLGDFEDFPPRIGGLGGLFKHVLSLKRNVEVSSILTRVMEEGYFIGSVGRLSGNLI